MNLSRGFRIKRAKGFEPSTSAAELVKIVSGQLSSKLIVPVPSYNEYANVLSNKTVEV